MTGQQKPVIIQLPSNASIHLLILHVPLERFEPSLSAQGACRPSNSATDPLGNPHSTIALFPS
jgi:hypothetical protein